MIYIGIDPGASGAIAWLGPSGPAVEPLKTCTDQDIVEILRGITTAADGDVVAMIENVHAFPGQGVKSVWNFSGSYHGLLMALVAAGVPFDRVTPQTWQRGMKCMSKGDKNVTKRRAQELFPGLKIIHATADALLIAEWCRRTWRPHYE